MIPVYCIALRTSEEEQTIPWTILRNTLPLRIDLRLVHNHDTLSLHLPVLCQLNQPVHLCQSFESVGVHGNVVLGYELQHVLRFFGRANERAADPYVAEDELGKGDLYVVVGLWDVRGRM